MNQSDFATALLSPEADVPKGLIDPQGRLATARFAVYRNNVTASILKVLQAAFPVVERLVGTEFFAAMAVEFLRNHPPRTRMMMLYGADFPAFLSAFPPVAALPYLPDVARLEQSLRESYHAADAIALAPDRFGALSPDALLAARLNLAPSLRLVRSNWPILSIWQVNTSGGTLGHPGPEAAVVLRNGYDPKPHALSNGAAAILAELLAGKTIEAALGVASQDTDLSDLLTLLISRNAVLDLV